jgi:hypothetical protein
MLGSVPQMWHEIAAKPAISVALIPASIPDRFNPGRVLAGPIDPPPWGTAAQVFFWKYSRLIWMYLCHSGGRSSCG